MTDLESFARSRVGSTLCRKYTLDALIGVGGMAAVYRATHRVGNRVAIKMLHPHVSISADIRARFLREGYVANQIDHEGAVRVLDDDTAEDGSVFLAMELLDGETLHDRWERGGRRLPPREVVDVGHRLLEVLDAAHAKGVVHRDIKPENLFLTRRGVLKVLDFGIARLSAPNAPRPATQTGRMLGTPAFMAPEQALGLQRDIDARTDLWSVGATLFTLASGQFVHAAETTESMLVFAGSRHARSLAAASPSLPAPLVAIVDRALAFERKDRWASATEMKAALEAAYLQCFEEPLSAARARGSFSTMAFDRTIDAAGPAALGLPTPEAPAARMPGGGTATGVSATSPARQTVRSGSRTGLVLGAAVALAGAAGLGLYVARPHAPPPAASPGAPAAALPSAPLAPEVPSVTASQVAPTPPPTASSVPPARSIAPAPSPASRPAPHPSAPSAADRCNPPYTVDENGHHHLKDGCY